MELDQAVRRRRMVRAFADRPVAPEVVDRILDRARHAPSAGYSQGFDFLVLEGASQTSVLWEAVSTPDWRSTSDRWPGLSAAPVVVLPLAHEQAYLDRYSEPDKAAAGLQEAESWPVPFWLVDTSFATMLVLLGAVEEGLGACFFGLFRGQEEALTALGVPAGHRPIGAVALGWPDPERDRPSPSLARGRRPFEETVHRGRW
ncbi:MAG: nitroreductase family protein [Acidimicrobiales bacterium]